MTRQVGQCPVFSNLKTTMTEDTYISFIGTY